MNVLIIDSDDNNLKTTTMVVKFADISVTTASTGEDAIEFTRLYNYDCIIVDAELSDMSGISFLKQIRSNKVETPVLFLSQYASIQIKLKAFESGADDFLEKPFNHQELIARVRAIIRRFRGFSQPTISFGNIVLNTLTKAVTVNGQIVHLTMKEYTILEILVMRKNIVITKEMFMDRIYNGIDEPEVKIIDVFICKLRKKLMCADNGINHIETVWGRGYTLRDENVVQ